LILSKVDASSQEYPILRKNDSRLKVAMWLARWSSLRARYTQVGHFSNHGCIRKMQLCRVLSTRCL
jgi:hypothetical protein